MVVHQQGGWIAPPKTKSPRRLRRGLSICPNQWLEAVGKRELYDTPVADAYFP